MIAFASMFPDVARRETRFISMAAPLGELEPGDIPPGEYAFLEFYCDEPGCDCQRVLLSVIARNCMKPVATISHSFDRPRAGAHVKQQTRLDPLNPNARYARSLMYVFETRMLDEDYDAGLRRHYQMVKQQIGQFADPPATPKRRATPLFGRSGIIPPPPRRGKKHWR